MGDLSNNFSSAEFAFPACGATSVSEDLVRKLQAARDDLEGPIYISSGFRCKEHNLKVGGVEESSHTKGAAVDIKVATSRDRWLLLWVLLQKFDRIGIGKDFIHVDVDEDKVNEVVWLY